MSKLKKYLITIVVGLLIVGYVAYTQGILTHEEPKMIFHTLSNSFFIPGVLIAGMGGLIFVANEGAFDGLTFAMKSFFSIFKRDKKNRFTSYYDYKVSKGDRNRGFGFMLITGLVFLAISGIMLGIYSNY